MNEKILLRSGVLVVFEGLDKAGKSTQIERCKGLLGGDPAPHVVHMPSGLSSATDKVYDLLESEIFQSSLARQLIHLGCHAESVPALTALRAESGVLLDRFWWSSVAYGWYGGHIGDVGVEWGSYMHVIDSIWGRLIPDLVFLFVNPYEEDGNNSDDVDAGYRRLAYEYSNITVFVPTLPVDETTDFIVKELVRRGLAEIALK